MESTLFEDYSITNCFFVKSKLLVVPFMLLVIDIHVFCTYTHTYVGRDRGRGRTAFSQLASSHFTVFPTCFIVS